MNPTQYTTAKASELLNEIPQVFLRKTYELNLDPIVIGKVNYWTMEQIEVVRNAPRKTRKDKVFVSEETKDNIFEYWKSNKDNRTSTIARHFEIPLSRANDIINEKLKPLLKISETK